MGSFGNHIIKLFLFSLIVTVNAQTQTRWNEYFSYANIGHIIPIGDVLYCSAENGYFTYNVSNRQIDKVSKINGLNSVGVSAFHYDNITGQLIIGYSGGAIDIVHETGNTYILDIPWNQYSGDKGVRHITSNGEKAIISGEFGLAVYDLSVKEFDETTFFVQGGMYTGVNKSLIYNDIIYAFTQNGVFYHPLNNQIPNFTNWESPAGISQINYSNAIEFNNQLLFSSGTALYRFDGINWSFVTSFGQNIKSLNTDGQTLSVIFNNRVINLGINLNQIEQIDYPEETLTTAIKYNGVNYVGTQFNGIINPQAGAYILPDGPYSNKSWSVTANLGQIWIAPGGTSNFNNVTYNSDGYSHFNGMNWIHRVREDIINAKDIVHVSVNPTDTTEIYLSSWFEFVNWSYNEIGLLRMRSNVFDTNFISNNSSLTFRYRIGGSSFDEDGNLWVSQAFAEENHQNTGVNKKTPGGNWSSLIVNDCWSGRTPLIGIDHVFVPCARQGGIAMIDKNLNTFYRITDNANLGDLPSNSVLAVTLDLNNMLWIGTELGLRVLSSPEETVMSGSFQTNMIVIMQNGLPEELFMNTRINDIAVDGSNRKWIATNAGVFYISEYGDETILRFTQSNSPLPSNLVYDITVDNSTGIVYFATENGLVSYRGDATEVGDSFGDVLAYPNPVRPGFKGRVVIRGLPNNALVKITDVVGNLIYETRSSGGIAEWDTNNFRGKPVASGIYLVLLSNRDGTETRTTKIAVVR